MQNWCVLAGVIAVVAFAGGADAALVRLDNPRSGKAAPPPASKAGLAWMPVTGAFGAAANGGWSLANHGAAFSEMPVLNAMPSFADLAGPLRSQGDAAPRSETVAQAPAPAENEAPLLGTGVALNPLTTGSMNPFLDVQQTLGGGWPGNGRWLMGEALAAAPEASTTGLLLTGAGFLWLLRRRNSRLAHAAEAVAGEPGELLRLPASRWRRASEDPAISIWRAS